MMSNEYVRVTKALADKGTLLPKNVVKFDTNDERYTSVYYYNEEHNQKFKQTGSVKGIRDVLTDKLVFDFDDEFNIENAQKDVLSLIFRLENEYKLNDYEIYFSGNKGFNLIVNLDQKIDPKTHENIACTIAKGLTTFDESLYDANQILRVPNSRHPKTGLHKIQLSKAELISSISDIKGMAKNPGKLANSKRTVFPVEKFKVEAPKAKSDVPEDKFVGSSDLPLNSSDPMLLQRPSQWVDYKWSLLQGNFNKKERHMALMIVAATCRGLGYDEELTRYMLLSADDKHCLLTGDVAAEDIESNIIPSVFSDSWSGGQYSYKNNKWLQGYCERLGINVDEAEMKDLTVGILDAFTLFKDYAMNIDSLTIKTGIEDLDKRLRITIGMLVGILGAPSSGKTTLAIQILNNMSKQNELVVFFSYDMYHSLVIQKLLQKHLGLTEDQVFDGFKKNDEVLLQKFQEVLDTEYSNVEFCFKPGQTPEDMMQTIKFAEQKRGKKCRLIVVDYNELVLSDMNDATSSSAYVINKIREIAILKNLCAITLLQPNKMSGGVSDELKSYRSIKGSSSIEQAAGIVLGVSRPGFDPKSPEEDKFMTVNCLKNRMGKLFSIDQHWDGFKGAVRTMLPEEKAQLNALRARKEAEKNDVEDKSEWK